MLTSCSLVPGKLCSRYYKTLAVSWNSCCFSPSGLFQNYFFFFFFFCLACLYLPLSFYPIPICHLKSIFFPFENVFPQYLQSETVTHYLPILFLHISLCVTFYFIIPDFLFRLQLFFQEQDILMTIWLTFSFETQDNQGRGVSCSRPLDVAA